MEMRSKMIKSSLLTILTKNSDGYASGRASSIRRRRKRPDEIMKSIVGNEYS